MFGVASKVVQTPPVELRATHSSISAGMRDWKSHF